MDGLCNSIIKLAELREIESLNYLRQKYMSVKYHKCFKKSISCGQWSPEQIIFSDNINFKLAKDSQSLFRSFLRLLKPLGQLFLLHLITGERERGIVLSRTRKCKVQSRTWILCRRLTAKLHSSWRRRGSINPCSITRPNIIPRSVINISTLCCCLPASAPLFIIYLDIHLILH